MEKVANIDMAIPSNQCPEGWQETGLTKRTCGRVLAGSRTCNVATFVTDVLPSYTQVCGRILAYQFGGTDGFTGYIRNTAALVSDFYVDGVALYYGDPAQHIWTFAVGSSETREVGLRTRQVCPCDLPADDNIDLPPYVQNDFFCESMNQPYPYSGDERHRIYSEDPLWDGENCLTSSNCCEFNRPPYFVKTLPGATSESIKAAICLNNEDEDSNVAVEVVELYIHE